MESKIEFIQQQFELAYEYYIDNLMEAQSLEEIPSLNLWMYQRLNDIFTDALSIEK